MFIVAIRFYRRFTALILVWDWIYICVLLFAPGLIIAGVLSNKVAITPSKPISPAAFAGYRRHESGNACLMTIILRKALAIETANK